MYEVIEDGKDSVSGKDRRIGFSIDPSSLFSGNGAELIMRVGEPIPASHSTGMETIFSNLFRDYVYGMVRLASTRIAA